MAVPSRNANEENVLANERTFFITSSIEGRRALLQTQRSAILFIEVLSEYRSQGKFLLHEFVVMPDHFHLLLTVDSESSIEGAVQLIEGGFAFQAGRKIGLRAPIWQKGFSDARVSTVSGYDARRKYIHENPVTRGLCSAPHEFPFSSARSGFQLDPRPKGLSG